MSVKSVEELQATSPIAKESKEVGQTVVGNKEMLRCLGCKIQAFNRAHWVFGLQGLNATIQGGCLQFMRDEGSTSDESDGEGER